MGFFRKMGAMLGIAALMASAGGGTRRPDLYGSRRSKEEIRDAWLSMIAWRDGATLYYYPEGRYPQAVQVLARNGKNADRKFRNAHAKMQ